MNQHKVVGLEGKVSTELVGFAYSVLCNGTALDGFAYEGLSLLALGHDFLLRGSLFVYLGKEGVVYLLCLSHLCLCLFLGLLEGGLIYLPHDGTYAA